MRIPNTFVAAGLAVALMAAPALADNFKRITTEAEFIEKVANKKVTWDNGQGKVDARGNTSGRLADGTKYRGKWKFIKGFYCSNLVINKKELGTNCQVAEIDGNKLRLTRDQGKGKRTVFTLK